jgi:hypothetical protein
MLQTEIEQLKVRSREDAEAHEAEIAKIVAANEAAAKESESVASQLRKEIKALGMFFIVLWGWFFFICYFLLNSFVGFLNFPYCR